jgi:hypothetical protein
MDKNHIHDVVIIILDASSGCHATDVNLPGSLACDGARISCFKYLDIPLSLVLNMTNRTGYAPVIVTSRPELYCPTGNQPACDYMRIYITYRRLLRPVQPKLTKYSSLHSTPPRGCGTPMSCGHPRPSSLALRRLGSRTRRGADRCART